jgi:phage-related minor tail protein
MSHLTMAKEDALFELVHSINAKLSEVDKHTAVHAEKMKQVAQHLEIMNGRIAKSEDRLSVLETIRAEMKGGYRVIAAIAAVVGAVASWLFDHWPKN